MVNIMPVGRKTHVTVQLFACHVFRLFQVCIYQIGKLKSEFAKTFGREQVAKDNYSSKNIVFSVKELFTFLWNMELQVNVCVRQILVEVERI